MHFKKLLANLGLVLSFLAVPAYAATGNTHFKSNVFIGDSANTANLTVTGTVTIPTSGLKRKFFTVALSPNTGAAADSTVYRGFVFPGRAGTVKKVSIGCQVAPTVGTDTIKILKAATNGNTMLSAATYDANSLTAATSTPMTLTSTAADLSLTATQGIYCEYSAGSQTVDAIGIVATIEYEPSDY